MVLDGIDLKSNEAAKQADTAANKGIDDLAVPEPAFCCSTTTTNNVDAELEKTLDALLGEWKVYAGLTKNIDEVTQDPTPP